MPDYYQSWLRNCLIWRLTRSGWSICTQCYYNYYYYNYYYQSWLRNCQMWWFTRSGRSICTQWLAPSTYLTVTGPWQSLAEASASNVFTVTSWSPHTISVGMVMPDLFVSVISLGSRNKPSKLSTVKDAR